MKVVLFDGVCNLCHGTVRFIIGRDPARRFRFAALQSAAAQGLLGDMAAAIPALSTVILVQDGRVFTKSDAALRIAAGLRFPWPLLTVFRVVPTGLRDRIYDAIGNRRYRWFGKLAASCNPEDAPTDRFLGDPG